MTRLAASSHKYSAIKTVVDGITFPSRKEASVYQSLKLQEREGLISDLELQPEYRLLVNGQHVCTYVGDFRYQEDGQTVVADAKGYRTRVYNLKKKLMRACYGIEIKEL